MGFGTAGVIGGLYPRAFTGAVWFTIQIRLNGGRFPVMDVSCMADSLLRFAVLTSIGMIGVFQPVPVASASVIASLVTVVVAAVRKDIEF